MQKQGLAAQEPGKQGGRVGTWDAHEERKKKSKHNAAVLCKVACICTLQLGRDTADNGNPQTAAAKSVGKCNKASYSNSLASE